MTVTKMKTIAQSYRFSDSLLLRMKRLFWRLISPLPDGPYLYLKYASIYGRFPDTKNPRRFSELQHLRKLRDRNPLYPVIVDKVRAKDVIRDRVGAQHVVPTYWVGTDLSEVDWAGIDLPAVVKPTHASKSGYFLSGQSDIDTLMARRPEAEWLADDHFRFNREWAYKDVPRQIIIEKRLGRPGEVLRDYRFYCFSGKLVHIELREPKDGLMFEAVYSRDWEFLDVHFDWYPHLRELMPRPVALDKMIAIAEKMSDGISFARVDLYDTEGEIYVGEITLYPSGGFETFMPDSYDTVLGSHWRDKSALTGERSAPRDDGPEGRG
ncbi:ATP-grasp fold amidoligase family protein [Roseibium sp. AS2]|uniref:ATP-grasp fold amidoligase family protein n=1 Tax=Roseibium sp. AS2 TaxID=3135781 RepID=UPI0031785923